MKSLNYDIGELLFLFCCILNYSTATLALGANPQKKYSNHESEKIIWIEKKRFETQIQIPLLKKDLELKFFESQILSLKKGFQIQIF